MLCNIWFLLLHLLNGSNAYQINYAHNHLLSCIILLSTYTIVLERMWSPNSATLTLRTCKCVMLHGKEMSDSIKLLNS